MRRLGGATVAARCAGDVARRARRATPSRSGVRVVVPSAITRHHSLPLHHEVRDPHTVDHERDLGSLVHRVGDVGVEEEVRGARRGSRSGASCHVPSAGQLRRALDGQHRHLLGWTEQRALALSASSTWNFNSSNPPLASRPRTSRRTPYCCSSCSAVIAELSAMAALVSGRLRQASVPPRSTARSAPASNEVPPADAVSQGTGDGRVVRLAARPCERDASSTGHRWRPGRGCRWSGPWRCRRTTPTTSCRCGRRRPRPARLRRPGDRRVVGERQVEVRRVDHRQPVDVGCAWARRWRWRPRPGRTRCRSRCRRRRRRRYLRRPAGWCCRPSRSTASCRRCRRRRCRGWRRSGLRAVMLKSTDHVRAL